MFVWPLTLNTTQTQQGQAEIGFDKERGLIHENPALQPWLKERLNVEVNLEETAGKLTALDRITWEDVLTAATECLKGFQRVSLLRESAPLLAVPKKDDQIPANQLRIYSSAAVSIIDWIHQSVVADLAKLSQEAGESQLLDLFLGLRSGDREDGPNETVPEEDRFFIADADPAQQKAVLGARKSKGLVIHGPLARVAYAEACDRGSVEAVEEILQRARSLSFGGFSGAESAEDYDSEFEMHVAEVLRHGGFKVETQVNEGEFRIDLAVVHPSEQRYALGIECDGATYHSSWTARSHDIWRQKVLQSCGWKIHRIWSTDWWRDPNTQIDALLEKVGRACSSII